MKPTEQEKGAAKQAAREGSQELERISRMELIQRGEEPRTF